MATFNVTGLDEAIKRMNLEAERIKKRGPSAVKAGAFVAKMALQQSAPVRTGQLSDAITIDGPFDNVVDGIHCNVFPDGTRKDGERNAEVGFVLEYGRSHMDPQPWMRPTIEREGEEISAAVADVLMGD